MPTAVDLKRQIYSLRNLPTLPVVARKILMAADDEGNNYRSLAAIVARNQALTTAEVQTELNQGAEFLMYFPSADGSVRKPDNKDQASNGGQETILLVDDEQQILNLMAAALSNQGYLVRTASNGAEALDQIVPEVGLVILDMVMPVMDGLSTLRKIRERFPETKVIVASGYTPPDRVAALEVLGVQGFLPKPFPLENLNRAVRDVLDDVAA